MNKVLCVLHFNFHFIFLNKKHFTPQATDIHTALLYYIRGNLGFSILPQGVCTGGAGDQTTDRLVSGRPAVPPQPQSNLFTELLRVQV